VFLRKILKPKDARKNRDFFFSKKKPKFEAILLLDFSQENGLIFEKVENFNGKNVRENRDFPKRNPH